MRITQSMLSQTALEGLQANQRLLMKVQKQAVTGKRVTRPADDPFSVEQALGFRTRIKVSETARQNISLSLDRLNATDKSLNDMTTILARVEGLALQGANETLGPEERQALAVDVNGMIEQAIAIGNSRHGEHTLFAGFQTDTLPFEVTRDPLTNLITSTTYNGDAGLIMREIEPGIDMAVNVLGDPLFTGVFDSLIDLRDALQAGPFDVSAVTAELTNVRVQADNILDVQAAIGTKVRRLETTANRMTEAEIDLRRLLSKAEDADMAEVVTQLNQQQFVYQTALAVNGRVLRTSLLDFLR